MSNETLQLLKAFIDAAGYDVSTNYLHPTTGQECDPPDFMSPVNRAGGYAPRLNYIVTKKKSKPRAQAKDTGYSKEFNDLWSKYPKGHCGSKKATSRKFMARLAEVGCFDTEYKAMFNGVARYALYIEATGYSVKSSETFFGRDRHYTNPFEITDNLKKQNRLKLPRADDDLMEFARKHELRMPKPAETFIGYRKSLQLQLDNLELNAN